MDEIREVHSLVYLLICSARSSVTEIYYVHVFPLDSRQCWALGFGQIVSRSGVWEEAGIISLARIKRENVHVFVQLYLRNG